MKHFRKAFTKPLFFLTAFVVFLMAAFWLVRERHHHQPREFYRNSLSHGVQQAKLHGIDDSDRDAPVVDSADVKRSVGHNDHPVAGGSPESALATHTESGASNSSGMDEKILAKLAQELGSWSMEIDAMNEVFVFVDGRYVGPPYAMKRTGYTVTLNGTTLYSSPPVKDGYESTLPVVPQNLDATSSRRDIWGRRQNGRTWLHRFINWHFSQLVPSDSADAALAAMRKLPFVKSIQIENDYVSTDDFGDRVPIKIGWTLSTQRDEVMKFDFRDGYPDLRPYSKEAF